MSLSNVTLTNSANTMRITIATQKVRDKLVNELPTTFVKPTTSASNTSTAKVVNLLKIIETIGIEGYIATGLGTNVSNPVERSNAKDVKDDLKSIFKNRNIITLSYDGDSYTVTIDALEIVDEARNGLEAADGEVRYSVTMNCIVSTNLIPV